MDPAPAIGIGLGFVVVIGANVMEGGNPTSLLLAPAILLHMAYNLVATLWI